MFRLFVVTLTSIGLSAAARAGDPPAATKLSPAGLAKANSAADKAIAFYRKQQADSGSLAPNDKFEMGITGLAVAGMLKTKRIPTSDPMIAKAMGFLETHVQ